MTWLPSARALLWIAGIAAALLLAFLLYVKELFEPGTPWSRLQRRIEMARLTTVLDRPRVINGVAFPARTEMIWEDPSHRRLRVATLPAPAEILGVRAEGSLRVVEGGWIVPLAGAQEIDGWLCADDEVEMTNAGRLRNCELLGAPTWRGWDLPEHSSVRPRPDQREVVLEVQAVGAWDTPFDSPVVGRMPWITVFNEDGSPSRGRYGRENPYSVAGQDLSGDVEWRYDPVTHGMGRERPPVSVSGFVHEGGSRRQVVLPWPGSVPPRREGSR